MTFSLVLPVKLFRRALIKNSVSRWRRSHRRCSVKKGVKNVTNFIGKHLFGVSSLFHEVVSLKAPNFVKKSPQHWCFPVKFTNFFRAPILKNICERLLLQMVLKCG